MLSTGGDNNYLYELSNGYGGMISLSFRELEEKLQELNVDLEPLGENKFSVVGKLGCEHLAEVTYIPPKGKNKERASITFAYQDSHTTFELFSLYLVSLTQEHNLQVYDASAHVTLSGQIGDLGEALSDVLDMACRGVYCFQAADPVTALQESTLAEDIGSFLYVKGDEFFEVMLGRGHQIMEPIEHDPKNRLGQQGALRSTLLSPGVVFYEFDTNLVKLEEMLPEFLYKKMARIQNNGEMAYFN